MIRIITGSTHRAYQDAVVQARTVPGLEVDLADVRDRLETCRAQHREDQKQLDFLDRVQDEDARTIESLQGQIALLRATVARTMGILAADREPRSAVFHTADAAVANADLLGIQGTTLAELRELAAPRAVFLLLRRGRVLSAHFSADEAKQEAVRCGADPDGWRLPDFSPDEIQASYRADWCVAHRLLDADEPWMTLGTTPGGVLVVLDPDGTPRSVHSTIEAACRSAAAAGLPITSASLIRVGVGTVLTPDPGPVHAN